MGANNETKFKVGDRVRGVGFSVPNYGKLVEGIVDEIDNDDREHPYLVQLDNGDSCWISGPVSPASPTIREGRYYRTRDGRKVGPARHFDFGDGYPFEVEAGWWVSPVGKAQSGSSGGDLISEWVDDPATPAAPADTAGYTVPLCAYEDAGGLFEIKNGKVTFRTQTIRLSSKQPAIVCLIENGQPKPSDLPHVHRNKVAAGKEAERLAKKYPGKRFGVYEYVSHAEVSKPAYKHEWQRLAADGQKIAAIKELREVASLDLVTAKRAVEFFIDKAA